MPSHLSRQRSNGFVRHCLSLTLFRHFIDEHRIYLHPVVLGSGKPFFTGPRPPLHLLASDRIVDDVIRLTYVPA